MVPILYELGDTNLFLYRQVPYMPVPGTRCVLVYPSGIFPPIFSPIVSQGEHWLVPHMEIEEYYLFPVVLTVHEGLPFLNWLLENGWYRSIEEALKKQHATERKTK